MTIAEFVLLMVLLISMFNSGLQYYTTVSTYPLFSAIPTEGFVGYHKAYERKLPLAIYLPYTLLMVGSLLLLFIRPEGVALTWVIVLLVLNGSIMAVSLAFAAPVHARLDHEGKREDLLTSLQRYNLPRLLAATASTLLAAILLVQSLSS